ncbi:MAG TPA: HAD family hydrolase [Cytophagales bacterium]|nr:HAD family hydrolase [Cytophagales bacterium]
MIKLIVTDLDGTLLDKDRQLRPEFWTLEQKLADHNILFAVASGRQYFNLLDLFERAKDRILFLAEDGTYIVYKGEELRLMPMKEPAVCNIIDQARTLENVHIVLCGKNSAYVEDSDEDFLQEARKYYKKIALVDDLKYVQDTFLKITLCDFNGAEKNSLQHFKDQNDSFNVALAGEIWLDLTGVSAHKGTAITFIQDLFDISPEETLVFGDFLNDKDMMPVATHSYAMQNAEPELKEAARHVTEKDNDKQGVIDIIYKLCFPDESH